jgi:hypothetical protein
VNSPQNATVVSRVEAYVALQADFLQPSLELEIVHRLATRRDCRTSSVERPASPAKDHRNNLAGDLCAASCGCSESRAQRAARPPFQLGFNRT